VGFLRDELLLDTHIWIWFLQNPEQLAHAHFDSWQTGERTFGFHRSATWEAVMLQARGEFDCPQTCLEWLSEVYSGIFEAPLTHEIALASQRSHFMGIPPTVSSPLPPKSQPYPVTAERKAPGAINNQDSRNR